MGSECDSAEEVTATRWHESPRSGRATPKRDGIARKVVHDLVEEFLGEAWGSGGIGRRSGSDAIGQGGTHFLVSLQGKRGMRK